MIKIPLRAAILLLVLVLVVMVSCNNITGMLPLTSFTEWNPVNPDEKEWPQRQSVEDSPVIHHASVQPTKVLLGDIMVVTAEVSDLSGIKSITADMGEIETLSLSLTEGSIYHGTWQGEWLVRGTSVKDYVTTIVATNSMGKSSTNDVLWSHFKTWL